MKLGRFKQVNIVFPEFLEVVLGFGAPKHVDNPTDGKEPGVRLKILRHVGGLMLPGLGIVVGCAGGLGAVAFRYLIGFFQTLIYSNGGDLAAVVHTLPWWRVVLGPAIGGAFVGPIVYFFAREAKGHGVPEVMDAVVTQGGVIRSRVALVKILASALCIGSGGSVGREGPIVQIGSAVGSSLGQMLTLPDHQLRVLVACGAAAGNKRCAARALGIARESLYRHIKRFGIEGDNPPVD